MGPIQIPRGGCCRLDPAWTTIPNGRYDIAPLAWCLETAVNQCLRQETEGKEKEEAFALLLVNSVTLG
jgi:hypothetical protein